MAEYETLSENLVKRMQTEKENATFYSLACSSLSAIRRKDNPHDYATLLRPAFVRDIDKIMNCPYYNRYADKTQVFSLRKNDDISRRALHVQLVSRIARTIGAALNLNLDLIEAIALGHDIGHTPFGHAGERYLDELFYQDCGRHFSHNIHSVRVLDKIFPYNISLQTLSGIASHNGELELLKYTPKPLPSFDEFDKQIERCYMDPAQNKRLIPSTLEGCVVRICDIIAYLGKDRQDAERAELILEGNYAEGAIGSYNAVMINNLMVNLVENSYGKDYIQLDQTHFEALKKAKQDNYALVYFNDATREGLDSVIKPMMGLLYERLKNDYLKGDKTSPVYTHHIDYIKKSYYKRSTPYEEEDPGQIVVDYIASMTDDYFLDLFAHLFPFSSLEIHYRGYFD